MKIMLIVLVLVVATALGAAWITARRGGDSSGRDEWIPERAVRDATRLLHGCDGDLEVVVLRYYMDPERSSFATGIWSESLALEGDWELLVVWLVNHGDAPIASPVRPLTMTIGDEEVIGTDVGSLLEKASPPDYFAHLVRSLSGSGQHELASHAIARVAVMVEARDAIDRVSSARWGTIELRPVTVGVNEVLSWEQRPVGQVAALIHEPREQGDDR